MYIASQQNLSGWYTLTKVEFAQFVWFMPVNGCVAVAMVTRAPTAIVTRTHSTSNLALRPSYLTTCALILNSEPGISCSLTYTSTSQSITDILKHIYSEKLGSTPCFIGSCHHKGIEFMLNEYHYKLSPPGYFVFHAHNLLYNST